MSWRNSMVFNIWTSVLSDDDTNSSWSELGPGWDLPATSEVSLFLAYSFTVVRDRFLTETFSRLCIKVVLHVFYPCVRRDTTMKVADEAKHKRLYYAYHTCFSWACNRPKIMPLMAQTSVKHGFDNFNALGADELWGRSRKKPSFTRLVQFTSAFETLISSEKKRRACITSSNSAIYIDKYVSSASYFSRCLYLSFYVIVCASIK